MVDASMCAFFIFLSKSKAFYRQKGNIPAQKALLAPSFTFEFVGKMKWQCIIFVIKNLTSKGIPTKQEIHYLLPPPFVFL